VLAYRIFPWSSTNLSMGVASSNLDNFKQPKEDKTARSTLRGSEFTV
jgi:hypothetical protein